MTGLTLPDEKVRDTMCIGDPASDWLKIVADREIDMAVIRLKERALQHILNGSVMERICQICPVSVVSCCEIAAGLRGTIARIRGTDK